MEYIKYADAFFPEEVPLLPLDWSIVFDTPEVKEILSRGSRAPEDVPGRSGPTMMITGTSAGLTDPGRTWQISWKRVRPADLASFIGRQGPWTFISTNSARQVWKSSTNQNIEDYCRELCGTPVC